MLTLKYSFLLGLEGCEKEGENLLDKARISQLENCFKTLLSGAEISIKTNAYNIKKRLKFSDKLNSNNKHPNLRAVVDYFDKDNVKVFVLCENMLDLTKYEKSIKKQGPKKIECMPRGRYLFKANNIKDKFTEIECNYEQTSNVRLNEDYTFIKKADRKKITKVDWNYIYLTILEQPVLGRYFNFIIDCYIEIDTDSIEKNIGDDKQCFLKLFLNGDSNAHYSKTDYTIAAFAASGESPKKYYHGNLDFGLLILDRDYDNLMIISIL